MAVWVVVWWVFFFSSRRRHTRSLRDWSSDVCSSDLIPPNAIHGSGFSAFGWGMIPIDLSYVGVAHSHPSGYAVPSHEDLLHVTGKIMVIAGAPYHDESSLKIYDIHGEPLRFEVKEGGSRPADASSEWSPETGP